MSATNATWSAADQRYAHAEGWEVIYSTGRGVDEIQKDDDSPRFKSDDDAKRHVRACAQAGSLLHVRALAYVKRVQG